MDKDQFRGTPNRLLPCGREFREKFQKLREHMAVIGGFEIMLKSEPENQKLKEQLAHTKQTAKHFYAAIARMPIPSNNFERN
jgi:hypothetical protein